MQNKKDLALYRVQQMWEDTQNVINVLGGNQPTNRPN